MPGVEPGINMAAWATRGPPPHLEGCLLSLTQEEGVRCKLKEHLEHTALVRARVADGEWPGGSSCSVQKECHSRAGAGTPPPGVWALASLGPSRPSLPMELRWNHYNQSEALVGGCRGWGPAFSPQESFGSLAVSSPSFQYQLYCQGVLSRAPFVVCILKRGKRAFWMIDSTWT